ncbi:hypothetical protein [Rathayibacter toxicus]|uniref:hypothetical protein n=1 Tax=Rathayibacter toxicus TaxID=145458 RepID=UPI000CE8FDA8|nr:hypothetical protein [Rathayibacter toxicus]PPH62543.1 hypothetical protein C5D13_10440 [Rathayibacter toxicus]PPI44377.1 hypothetical protein C5D43_10330 [Rathayibacter toxicus]QWL50407.1 hypothetical protein E2R44_01025 [Rathayibacter toxicus]
MTKHQKPRNISIDDGWTIEVPSENGVERRTLVKGAAWSVPIIATAGATPAFAASPTPTLAFTQSSYSGTGCGTITGVQVKRTVDGTAPDAGKTVSVTLADGYTFADGTTTYSGTTDANGLITLPDIKVPAKGGNSKFSASSDTLAASASVSGTQNSPALSRYNVTDGKLTDGPDTVPANSTVVGNVVSLAPNGDLHQLGVTTAIATNVTSAVATIDSTNNKTYVTYISNNNLYRYNLTDKTTDGPDAVPANSTVVGNVVSLSPSGDLHQLGVTTAIATNVTSAVASIDDTTNKTYVTYISNNNLYRYNLTDKTTEGGDAVPANSTVVGNVVSLSPSGDLHQLGVTTAIATNVTSAVASIDATTNKTYVTYISNNNLYRYNVTDQKAVDGPDAVPANSTVVGNVVSLAPNGDLHQLGVKTAIATNVTSAVASIDSASNKTYVTYFGGSACKTP